MSNGTMKINLSIFPERFAESSKELSISKKVNFVFGKNGTGKSTIAQAIRTQFSQTHNVCVFDGYEGVVGENRRLDAIALGTENAEIQEQIDLVEKEIAAIKTETEQPQDGKENLFTKSEKATKEHKVQEKKIDDFYTEAAKTIKNKTNPQIAKTSYDKNAFKSEIEKAKLLSEDEIKRHKETIKSEPKAEVVKIVFPVIDLKAFLKSTNEVLAAKVAQQQVIAELQGNTDKQNFAKEGLRIHQHESGEKCAFCGNEISEERWALLGSYFNDEVKKLEARIDAEIGKITSEIRKLDGIKDITKSDFYSQFSERIELFNAQIKNVKNDYKKFLESLKSALEAKKKNLFASSDALTLSVPQDFNAIQTEYNKIVDESNIFSQNLKTEQNKAKDALRFHEVKTAVDTFKYDVENSKLAELKTAKEQAAQALLDKTNELDAKKMEKNGHIAKTKDESKLAGEINKLLRNMGVASFSLELVKDNYEGQKGQYKIRGHNGNIRLINELSKGEKNIIAFLYFILSLSQPPEDSKTKIIVLDDPMTSNDDSMQYLMTEQTRKLYGKVNGGNDYFLLLTHNLHFYLNVRPNYNEAEENKIFQRNKKQTDDSKKEKTFYEKNGYFILKNDGTQTTIQAVCDFDDDFKTSYTALWKDLIFLYDKDKPVSMLNNCRRIIETYTKFNNLEAFYAENEFVRKLFNVNSHSIDDQENELNGKTREDIKNMLCELFKNNNAEDHFNNYWSNK